MKCYECGEEKDVLYNVHKETKIEEKSTENCEVFELKKMKVCKDCLNIHVHVYLSVYGC